MNFNVYPYWWECGLNEDEALLTNDSINDHKRNFFLFNNTRVVKIDPLNVNLFCTGNVFETDIVILSGNVKGNLEHLLQGLKYKKVIIDSSNSMSKAAKWLKEAAAANIPCYSVLHNGAYVCDL